MKPYVEIHIPAGTLRAMTDDQFHALRDNILREGVWENVEGPLLVNGGESSGYIGVHLPSMFIGIEPDGYTHS